MALTTEEIVLKLIFELEKGGISVAASELENLVNKTKSGDTVVKSFSNGLTDLRSESQRAAQALKDQATMTANIQKIADKYNAELLQQVKVQQKATEEQKKNEVATMRQAVANQRLERYEDNTRNAVIRTTLAYSGLNAALGGVPSQMMQITNQMENMQFAALRMRKVGPDFNLFTASVGEATKAVTGFGVAGLAIGTAIASWKMGRAIAENKAFWTGLNDVIQLIPGLSGITVPFKNLDDLLIKISQSDTWKWIMPLTALMAKLEEWNGVTEEQNRLLEEQNQKLKNQLWTKYHIAVTTAGLSIQETTNMLTLAMATIRSLDSVFENSMANIAANAKKMGEEMRLAFLPNKEQAKESLDRQSAYNQELIKLSQKSMLQQLKATHVVSAEEVKAAAEEKQRVKARMAFLEQAIIKEQELRKNLAIANEKEGQSSRESAKKTADAQSEAYQKAVAAYDAYIADIETKSALAVNSLATVTEAADKLATKNQLGEYGLALNLPDMASVEKEISVFQDTVVGAAKVLDNDFAQAMSHVTESGNKFANVTINVNEIIAETTEEVKKGNTVWEKFYEDLKQLTPEQMLLNSLMEGMKDAVEKASKKAMPSLEAALRRQLALLLLICPGLAIYVEDMLKLARAADAASIDMKDWESVLNIASDYLGDDAADAIATYSENVVDLTKVIGLNADGTVKWQAKFGAAMVSAGDALIRFGAQCEGVFGAVLIGVGTFMSTFVKSIEAGFGKMTSLAIGASMAIGAAFSKLFGGTKEGQLGGQIGGAVGAIAGSFFGPIGAAIGGALGQAVGAFIGSLFAHDWKKDVDRYIGELGLHISDELTKQIAELGEKVHDSGLAVILSIRDIANEVKITAESFQSFYKLAHDIFSYLERGQIDAAKAAELLGSVWNDLLTAGTDQFGLWNDEIKDLINLTERFGVEVQEIADAIESQLTAGIAGFAGILKEGAERATTFHDKMIEALRADILKDSILSGKNKDEMLETLDEMIERGASLTEIFEEFRDSVGDRLWRKFQQGMKVTRKEFEHYQNSLLMWFNTLIAQGYTTAQALEMIGPQIQELQTMAQQFGFTLTGAFNQLSNTNTYLQEWGTTINGVMAQLTTMSNLQALTQKSFNTILKDARKLFRDVMEDGRISKKEWAAIGPLLALIVQLQQQYGFEVDKTTQALINQARKQNLLPKETTITTNVQYGEIGGKNMRITGTIWAQRIVTGSATTGRPSTQHLHRPLLFTSPTLVQVHPGETILPSEDNATGTNIPTARRGGRSSAGARQPLVIQIGRRRFAEVMLEVMSDGTFKALRTA